MSEPTPEPTEPSEVDPFAWRPVRRRGLGRGLDALTGPLPAVRAPQTPSRAGNGPKRREGRGLDALIPAKGRRYADGKPRRVAGFAAPAPEPPAPTPPPAVPPAVLAATLSVPRRVETEWLVAPALDGALHHGELGLHAVHDLALDEQHRVPRSAAIGLSCGEITRVVSFPAPWQRTDAARCAGCCTALGYPHGKGSPVNDPGCRGVLAGRFAELA